MHSAVQTADVTIISYKPLSDLNLLGTHNTMAVTCPILLWSLQALGQINNYTVYTLGMLSKAKGQILRVAATMHILFHLEKEDEISDVIVERG